MIRLTVIFFTVFSIHASAQAQMKGLETDSLAGEHFLNEVVVTGTMTPRTLKNTPTLTKVISGNEISQSGATTLVEALENFIPGVSFTPNQAMGDNIQIQGVDNKYILILVDGERLVGERTEKVNLSRLNTSDVKRVEIVNGASSALYGSNAVGSVINIITRDVDRPLQGDVRYRRSSYLDVMDASFGFKVKDFSSKTAFSRKDLGTYEVKNTSYVANPYEDLSLSQLFRYKSGGLTAELKASFYRQENWLLQKNQTRVDENFTLGGKAQYVFSPKNTLTLSGNRDSYEGNSVYKLVNDSTVRANASQYSSFRLTDVWNPTDRIQLVSGAEANYESVFSYNQFNSQDEKRASNWNLFAQAELKSETGLGALLGARYIHHSRFGGYLAPNASLIYRLDNFRFRGNLSNGFKTPTLKELYMEFPHLIGENVPFWIIGNENLSPEKSWYKALSAEYINSSLNVSVTAYDNSIRNKINTISVFNESLDRTEMRYENVENARVRGLETSLQYSFLKHFQLRGGYAFTDATMDTETGSRPLSGNSRHTATAGLTFRQSHLPFLPATRKCSYNMMLSARAMSPRSVYSESEGEVTELSTGSYHTVHFVYTQRFPVYGNVKGDFQFGINNLTDNVNGDFAEYNPGRTYFVSLGLRIEN